MDAEQHNFRIDPRLLERARAACADLGIELNDVLRALIARIATEGTVPLEIPLEAPRTNLAAAFFDDYDERLWSPLKNQTSATLALDLLTSTIAALSERLNSTSDAAVADEVRSLRDTARTRLATLDPADGNAVEEIVAVYTPLLGRLIG